MSAVPEKIPTLEEDPKKYAKAADLVYVSDALPGIERKKRGKGYIYLLENKKVGDKEVLERIKKLVLPPAWKNVWICRLHNGHLQATGVDALERKQYKYHHIWNKVRNETKFQHMLDFGKALPALRLQLEKDINLPELTQEKVIATVISLMERTSIRIGNQIYEKEYGSYGLTTLKNRHVKIEGNAIQFSFKGKKGVHHSIDLRSKKLAKIVKQCRDIPGKELFQYLNGDGTHHVIDSGKVNEYIKQVTGGDFSAKDFRTWAGTVNALRALKKIGEPDTVTASKKNIVEALDFVSSQLGNTRTVCKKYYVHPVLLTWYETNELTPYLAELDRIEKNDNKPGLRGEEEVLMKILKKSLES